MVNKIKHIIQKFRSETEKIEDANLNDLRQLKAAIHLSRKTLQNLREVVRQGEFSNKSEEITFFKEQKPFVLSRIIFFVRLYNYYLKKPHGTLKWQRKQIDLVIQNLQKDYQQYLEFTKYYRDKSEILDNFYFLRGNEKTELLTYNCTSFGDNEFSTSHDNAVAYIMAYDLLMNFFSNELIQIRNKELNIKEEHLPNKINQLKWTGTKTDLVELIYALNTSGAIKSGDSCINELANACEQVFDIDLGNYYRTYLEIRARKVERTKFIDRLRNNFVKRIEDADY